MSAKTLLARDPALLSEAEFASLIADTARLGGWKRYHTFRSKRSPSGFPDEVLVKGPRLIFTELKTEVGKTSPAQEKWLEALREVETATKGLVQVYVWRPGDWSEIAETLLGRRPA